MVDSEWIEQATVSALSDTVGIYHRTELSFIVESQVDNPFQDIEFWVEFEHLSSATSERVRTFWDGGKEWKARFKPHLEGEWSWSLDGTQDLVRSETTGSLFVSSESTSSQNTLLQPLDSENSYPLPRLRVSDNGRYLSTIDGEPFFWLGDTAWEITWKSYEEEMLAYLDDRQAKGFTVIQVVVMSHQRFFEFGVRNRKGETYFEGTDHSRLNPTYFHYLDQIVGEANKRGMIVALVPMWAHMMELHHMPEYHQQTISKENALHIADYVGARYAGSDVIWIVGGDNAYDSFKKREFWSEFAQRLDAASGGWHLMTVHTKGHTSSYDFFNSDTPWLDFHMYQSGHLADGDYTWKAAQRGWSLSPVKPVVNGEPNYEDIYNKLWQPADTSFTDTYRIQPEHVRRASWESILSGSTMGITYGANGVWQWNTRELGGTHFPRYWVDEAIQFEGSSHMRILREMAEEYDFQNWRPLNNIVQTYGNTRIAHVENRNGIVAYIPVGVESITLHLNETIVKYDGIELRNPKNSERYQSSYSIRSGPFTTKITTPNSAQDWVLFVPFISPIMGSEYPETVTLRQNYPNPFNPMTTIDFTLPDFEYVWLEIYNVYGQRVSTLLNGGLTPGYHTVRFDASAYASGIYYYQLRTPDKVTTRAMQLIR